MKNIRLAPTQALPVAPKKKKNPTKKISRRSHRGLHCFLFRNVAVPHRHERTQENFPCTFTGGNIEGISLWRGLILSSVIHCIESIRWITQYPQNNTELRLCMLQLFCKGKKKIVRLFSTKVFSPKRIVRNYKYIYIYFLYFASNSALSSLHSHPSVSEVDLNLNSR